MTILIVEDDDTHRKVMVDALTAQGFTILTAHDGLEAMSVMKSHKVAMIVSDTSMPYIDGFELHRRIKKQDTDTDFILYTSSDSPELQVLADDLGISKFITNAIKNIGLIKSEVLARLARAYNTNSDITKKILES